ncbi:hypothetical protein [Nocardia amamiensis]|uniref:Uncharacterized protein n=1 Tax=Nocardia amamiensis TaxID=404578 RepID=A0ABS0CNK4_9NOCA|nr:hypothetical protein [Nocardia amamiensis]MBF6296444.1 hypothetical protein [Nocardia amamiensis]
MHNTTVRGALRGTTATLAVCAALTSGAAVAGAAPLRLEPAAETTTAPVAEEYTSSGSSTISSSVHAKIACLFFAGNLAC